jgi:putative membrane protein
MNQQTIVTSLCAFVFLAAAGTAQSATRESRGKQRDKQFLRMIAIADMTEAHLGEMAATMAAKPEVKDLGQALAKDETTEYEQLTVLANKAGETIPKGIDTRRYPAIRRLITRKGGDFDRDFLRNEIADERRVISALQVEASHGSNPDIKAWAAKGVSARQQELQKAQSLAK